MWDSGVIAMGSWWGAVHSYLGSTTRSYTYGTDSSGIQLKDQQKMKSIPKSTQASTDYDTKNTTTMNTTVDDENLEQDTLSPTLHDSSNNQANESGNKFWKGWRGNRNILQFTTHNESQMQSNLDATVDDDQEWPLREEASRAHHVPQASGATNDTNISDQSIDLVIQGHGGNRDSWVDVERGYVNRKQ
jgi:hypothetical protein